MIHTQISEKNSEVVCAATFEEVAAMTRRRIWIYHHHGAIIVKVFLRKVEDGQ